MEAATNKRRGRRPLRLVRWFALFIAFLTIVSLGTYRNQAQNSAEIQPILLTQELFEATDIAAFQQGEPVVRLLPVEDKKEVAVYGLVRVQASTEVFLQSFRDSMAHKSNPAILEIGRFSSTPPLDDMQTLTMENRDVEDLKECVVGDCQLKLSATMIDRFHKEVDWQAADYPLQATRLFKLMLLEYVRDYLQHGDDALIEYDDKAVGVRLADEQRALFAASRSVDKTLQQFPADLKLSSKPTGLSVVEDALVWSKIKFGLKPVLAINHIVIYKREQKAGPQILIASKQIYANHYFNSSVALTAFVNSQDTTHESYLLYQNRSRADGLGGLFGKLKRGVIEREAMAGLKGILQQTKLNLDARVLNGGDNSPLEGKRSWREWKFGSKRLLLGLAWITALVVLILGTYRWRGALAKQFSSS